MKKETNITSINVRVDIDTKNRVTAIAQEYNMTISELVRGWFNECLELEEDVIAQPNKISKS